MSCTVYHYLDGHHPRVVIQDKVSQAAELMMLQCNVSLVLTSRTPAHCLSKLPVSRARWQVASARQLTGS